MTVRIDGTNTSASPGITGSDTDTGLSFGTNEVSLNTAGTERFRVGSAGQLGIGGATYGTDGHVLTSGGASAAPAWEAPKGLTWLDAVEVNGETDVTVTGIPTTAEYIKIAISHVSVTSTAAYHMLLQFGNGSVVTTSNYKWGVSYGSNFAHNNSDTVIQLIHSAFTGNGSNYDGTFELSRISAGSNWWVGSWVMCDRGGQNYTNVGGGFYNGSDRIDRVKFFPNSNTYDAGWIRVGYA